MKQKKFGLLLVMGFLACSALIGCGSKKESEPVQPSESQSPSESQTVNEYTIKFVNDDGTVLQQGKVEEGEMPVYTGVTPTKAATEDYSYTFAKWVPDIVAATADATYTASYDATQLRFTVTFDSNGGSPVDPQKVARGQTATRPADPTRPAEGTSTFTFAEWQLQGQAYDFATPVNADITLVAKWNVTEYSEPTIAIEGSEREFSMNAGETLQLPAVTATDYLGHELDVEFEDSFGDSSISNGVFSSKVAGAHEITFYAEDSEGGYDTETITVNVIPANAETAVTAEENNPANITNYSTYKENFAKGSKSPYYKSLVDGQRASYISGTDEAIAGNSLIFNAKTIIGSANCLFGKVIHDVVRRETQVTYTISFDYKAINSDGCFNGLYFSLSYDTSAGAMGKDTKLAPQVGQVVHFEETYSRFVFPASPTNCYMRIFNHNASNPNVDSFMAIDNIVVTAKEETQITYVSPTTEQLLAEGGFSWNMSTAAAEISNTSFIAVNELEDATIKAAVQGSEFFGENVIKVQGQADHQMRSLNKNNVIAGKILEVSFWFYSVKDLGAIIYMGCNGGNPTINGDNISTEVISGNIKKTTAKLLLNSYGGTDVVNFYGTSAADEIYIGKITARLYDYIPPQEVIDKPSAYVPTTAELEAGYTWNMVDKFLDFDNSEYIDVANMEDATIKAAIQANNEFGANVLRFRGGKMALGIGKNNLTAGHIFDITIDYYSVSDAFQYLIVYGDGNSNYTQPGTAYTRETVSGNFKRFHFSVELTAEMLQLDTLLTTYNGTVEMYIGKVTISCVEPEIVFTNYTPTAEELAAGFSWEIGSANHHLGFSSCNEVVKVDKIENATVKAALQGKGTYVDHVTLGGGANAQIVGLSGTNVPDGKELTIVLEYYEVTAVQYFLVNGHAQDVTKEDLGNGLKRITFNTKPTTGFEYFSLYNSGEVYLYAASATVADYEAPQDQTPNGYKVGDVITLYQSGANMAGGTSKNITTISNYENDIDDQLAAHPGLGTAPKKVTWTGTGAADGNIELVNLGGVKVEQGVTYKFTVHVYNFSWNGALFLNCDNSQFIQMSAGGIGGGYQELTVQYKSTAGVNWLCLYTNTKTMTGSFYIGNITAEVVALA